MKEKTKRIAIDDVQYQIGRFSPEVGSYIALNILGALVKAQKAPIVPEDGTTDQPPQQETEERDPQEIVRGMTFAAYLSGLEYDLHCFIQKKCLEVCSRLEGPPNELLPMPLAKLPDVLQDMPLVMRLETETLAFNLADFFGAGGLSAMTGNPQPSNKARAASRKG